jgi:hypothetical protein
MKIIGIVGTAKNTGKTTTLAALIEQAARAPEGGRLAVTGIGYDGEEIDTVTGLPKPRLMLQPGTVVATSVDCLKNTTASYHLIKETDAETALGRVVIVEIETAGMMVLAGPNTKRHLRSLIAEMHALGMGRLFVDGSLNRIAAMGVVDTVIFTTGASRSTEIIFLSEEARSICRLFEMPEAGMSHVPESVTLIDQTGAVRSRLSLHSLYDTSDARDVVACMNADAATIVIPKMASRDALEYLVNGIDASQSVTIVLNDPTIMLLAGDPIGTSRVIDEAAERGIAFAYLHPIRVAAMTVNPFYPRQHDHAFTPAYIDKDELLVSVSDSVHVPVFNIKEPAAPEAIYALL